MFITKSAGLLMYRESPKGIEVLLCRSFHFGKKVRWGIPKGRITENEKPFDAALREFEEETGLNPPTVPMFYLGTFAYPSGRKSVSVWTFQYNPPEWFNFKSNFTKAKNPQGEIVSIPEIEEWSWININDAENFIMPQQMEVIKSFKRLLQKNMEIIRNGKENGIKSNNKDKWDRPRI